VRSALRVKSWTAEGRSPFTTVCETSTRKIRSTIGWASSGCVRANAKDLDTLLQCISFTFRPGFVRTFANMVVQLMGPPQPVHVGDNDESAFQFAQAKCREKVDWSAASRARDQTAGAFSFAEADTRTPEDTCEPRSGWNVMTLMCRIRSLGHRARR